MNSLIKSGDNPILTEERKKGQFSTDTLAAFYHGDFQKVKRRREIYEYYCQNKELHDPEPIEFMDRYHRLENAQRKVTLLKKHLKNVCPTNDPEESGFFHNIIFLNDGSPLGLHHVMAIPTILNNADAEQQALWLPKAINFEFIATYAQTELGHGTNLRFLETTATYDPKSEEFVLHSPKVTSAKW
jgi:acyl-CoA oxidase